MGALFVQGAPKQRECLHSGLSYKRLEAGRFIGNWRDVRHSEMDYTGLKLLLEGIEVKLQKKRFRLVRNQDQRGMRDAAASIPSSPC